MIKSGLDVVEVAHRLGHSAEMTLGTYAHAFEELGDERVDPTALITAARTKIRAAANA
jgi:hypothetical protein